MDQDNKQIYSRFCEELFNRKNLSIIDELVHSKVVSHSPFPKQRPGAAGLKEAMFKFFNAFTNINVKIEDMFAGEDKVVGRLIIIGTHTGEFMGIPASNKSFSYPEISIVRFENGKIVEHWAVSDVLQMMQQIGALD